MTKIIPTSKEVTFSSREMFFSATDKRGKIEINSITGT
jgi:hypothetical protein